MEGGGERFREGGIRIHFEQQLKDESAMDDPRSDDDDGREPCKPKDETMSKASDSADDCFKNETHNKMSKRDEESQG